MGREVYEVRKHYRRKARVSKDRLPPNLPVEIVEHFLPEEKHHALNVVKPFMLWVKRSAGNSS